MSVATRITVNGVRSSCEASRVKLRSRSTKRPRREPKSCSAAASARASLLVCGGRASGRMA
jgi:hypothetical protein